MELFVFEPVEFFDPRMNHPNDMTPSHGPDPDAHSLEYEAAAMLVDALAKPDRLHLPGARERHRHRLERAIDLAQAALEAGERVGATPETILLQHAWRNPQADGLRASLMIP